MKNIFKTVNTPISYRTVFIIWMICLLAHVSFNVLAQNPAITFTKEGEKQNAFISEQTKTQLLACQGTLNYPKSVERFYKEKGYKLVWVEKQNHNRQLAPAMMILDCVSQFGLNRQDFHAAELVYQKVNILSKEPDILGGGQRAIFDVLMTDAMITFMNHLHYGKFNNVLTPSRIDDGGYGDFNAEARLLQLMESMDFYNEIAAVQPLSKEYDDLQKYMHLVRGQYLEDSYEFPEESVKKMTINMERLRWLSASQTPSLIINIPAFTAKMKLADAVYIFKIIVGKPSSPTPIFESKLAALTAVPDRSVTAKMFIGEVLPGAIKNPGYLDNNHYAIYDTKGRFVEITAKKLLEIKRLPKGFYARQSEACGNTMGKILFRLAEASDIYLHDMPLPKLARLPQRALSNGCIQIDQAEKLAGLLLIQDGSPKVRSLLHSAIASDKTTDFILNRSVPIKITYQTCEMIDSQLVIYKDIYNQDRALEMAMYGYERLLASDKKIKAISFKGIR
ncbi:L,D-transpeptidase family protein [Pedobacter petrophilus]|uniref:L,D-transpeptidase family protein n=1 Tax=Pedobacter petrophilus TaxID=1908241 RepID=A0A7K0G6M8_9SPHI|nr:L,D-transpeptidase family protein [Pedobacter petrophilus]MRX78849.1 L,D-transpeptidase family protein [Pedobacter petrophilus]